ncbi:MAG: nitroreductase family protein [Bacteroidetes bacterium]|nr:nitroreductase family protein [Bacteroidota bacterium]MBU1114798.1 nitroreductase family protein [Bacteroidota bacterium]MBU1799843.1 nitroreductase family protein [Bacteroidota bacterium]
MTTKKQIPLKNYEKFSDNKIKEMSEMFYAKMDSRRTVRTFSSEPISIEVLKNAIKAANTSPSGANKQPWHFVLVQSAEIKKKIRIAAEKEEKEFYSNRAPAEWLKDLEPFETDEHKPFLETAPYLIVVFEEKYKIASNGEKAKNYYTKESVGLACGILLVALHNVGIATLTHTPSPMKFLAEILKRPKNETPFLLIVAGYPEVGTVVPNIKRKELNEILTII